MEVIFDGKSAQKKDILLNAYKYKINKVEIPPNNAESNRHYH